MDKFIVIVGRAWCNAEGVGIDYNSDLVMHETRAIAVYEGTSLVDSDDFNIGVVRNGKLISLDWMDEVVESDPVLLSGIAGQICLEAS